MSDWSGHCAEPAAVALNHATGRDIWAELGDCPRSWREAADLYRRLGVTNLGDAVTKVLGDPIPVRRAMRGDIAMVRGALGVIRGELIECMGANVPIGEADRAWSVKGRPPFQKW